MPPPRPAPAPVGHENDRPSRERRRPHAYDDEDDRPRGPQRPPGDDGDDWPRCHKQKPEKGNKGLVIGLSIAGGVLLVGLALVLILVLLPAGKETPPRFNPKDVHETARWAGEVLKPLDTAAKINNGIVRDETLRAEMVRVKAEIEPLVGQAVSWEMGCDVFTTHVTLPALMYGKDGKSLQFARLSEERNPITMMVVDKHPKENPDVLYGDHPDFRNGFIDVDVPSGISKAEAAKLTDRVIVNAKIKEVEIGTYKNQNYKERFLLYLYLTDVKLKPVER
jgi:hypothetical protein